MFFEWLFLGCILFVLLALDLGVFHRKAHVLSLKEAAWWSVFWVGTGIVFFAGLWLVYDRSYALVYLTAYVVEKALSVDNLFLFIVIFNYFSIDRKYQHRILFWGIIGAIITRGILIFAGITLIQKFDFLVYLFGVIILASGIKTLLPSDTEYSIDNNLILRLVKKYIPSDMRYKGPMFFIKVKGRYLATRMFVVLIVVELTDILFALDSIPAVIGITTDPYLVYSSNIFAILGLRSLYFVLSGMMEIFAYMKYAISIILIMVGLKMLLHGYVQIPEALLLACIGGVLFISILPSVPGLIRKRRSRNQSGSGMLP
jgi:tellurite resistance protein TerC